MLGVKKKKKEYYNHMERMLSIVKEYRINMQAINHVHVQESSSKYLIYNLQKITQFWLQQLTQCNATTVSWNVINKSYEYL